MLMFFIYLKVLLPGQLHLSCVFLGFPLSKLRPIVGYDGQPSRHLAKIFYFFFKFLCRVPTREALGKELLFFFENFLCRVPTLHALGKAFFFKILCRAPTRKALGKELLFFFENFLCRVPTLQALGKV